jgi:acyl-coenzyme A synthetase/AMP-(fatty) acid ligase
MNRILLHPQWLAVHEYPRQAEFAETLPMIATGKVLRTRG